MSEQRHAIAICGAGPVGMLLALLLAKRGQQDALLIDAKALDQAVQDPRSIALSYGSRQLLEEVGAWPLPATAIHQIHVSRRGHFGRSMIDRAEHHLPALGYVTRYGELVAALAAACSQAGIQALRPARVSGHLEDAEQVLLRLDDGRDLAAGIVVQAEGGVFGEQENRALTRDYGQTAIIARVAAASPVAHRAFERFTGEGPLALLPQDGADGMHYALVWCVKPEHAQDLLVLNDADFLQALGTAFGTRLGRFTAASKRVAYPLGLNAQARATKRTVAIGNAAQTLHPVAGQGLNLGLRDAAVLARLLVQDQEPDVLERFGQERARDRQLTVHLTDAMARAFTAEGPGQALLGLSLHAIDTLNPARALLAELMMFGSR